MFEIFRADTHSWRPVAQVDEAQMREVDRIAVEEFRLGILQMMENAGRNLAGQAFRLLNENRPAARPYRVLVAAGSGGNGGGGLSAARHLHNQGVQVDLMLTSSPDRLGGAAEVQLSILRSAGVLPMEFEAAADEISGMDLVLDALIGYSLRGAPRGAVKKAIELINGSGVPVVSLDLPSGVDATRGDTPGVKIQAAQTLTLALPKPGLKNPASGELFLADIGIPPEVYLPLGIKADPFGGGEYILPLRLSSTGL